MKNILGLDLGTSSVGWALIEAEDAGKPTKIIDMGVRIVPLTEDEGNKFTKGQSITTSAERTKRRTTRKCYDRYQLRRSNLTAELKKLNMLPDEHLIKLPVIELWQLRAKAVTEMVELPELGRILYHLNQKRGYKHSSGDDGDSKVREYVATINNRYDELKKLGLTIGQLFYQRLKETAVQGDSGQLLTTYRIKDKVYPRKAYEEEFDRIMSCQQRFYPEILNDEEIDYIKNNIIYYQRVLKSCKHLVSVCEFEKRCFYDADGNVIRNENKEIIYDGPKVTPRTSPLFQLRKDWEAVNNIKFHNRHNEELFISAEQRAQMVKFMETHELLKLNDVYAILGITKGSGWYAGKLIGKGLKGNSTRLEITRALSSLPANKIDEITRFDLKIAEAKHKNKITGEFEPVVNEETGEIMSIIDSSYLNEPLYRLWHILYSIKEDGKENKERKNAIAKFLSEFGLESPEIVDKLSVLNFINQGYGNMSAKAICKTLPYLMQGLVFSDACEYVGYNHSGSITTEENKKRELLPVLPAIKKNELRQPTVEKILNQMINIFNSLNKRLTDSGHTRIDEVRIELARELKQSKEERDNAFRRNNELEKANKKYAGLIKEFGVDVTRNRLMKYRLLEESEMKCFYCNQPINVREFLLGIDVEREHILPKALLYDNSFSNQVCSCRRCNELKGKRTAYDFMRSQINFDDYLDKVDTMAKNNKISHTKQLHLLASYEDYLERKKSGNETREDVLLWETFIERQLRLSQFIASKAQDILFQGCRNVLSTSGSITELVRHSWGYDTILQELNIDRYRKAGQTSIVQKEYKGQFKSTEVIDDWTKRLDHRHHAIDALAIACTSHSIIQRINTLNASREDIAKEIKTPRSKWDDSNMLQEWIKELNPFDRKEVLNCVAGIIISMKAGKRVTTPGKRYVYSNGKPVKVQEGLLIPRGPLHEQQVYGKIHQYEKDKNGKSVLAEEVVFRYPLGIGMGCVFSGKESCDVVKDAKSGEYILKDGLKTAVSYIVDRHIQKVVIDALNTMFPDGEAYDSKAKMALAEKREYNGAEDCKKALKRLKDLEHNPIYADSSQTIPVRRVRCKTGLNKSVQPLRYIDGKAISFVLTKNNHHVAIYKDENDNMIEHIVTYWDAVLRKKNNVPIIIENSTEVWENINTRKEPISQEFLSSLPARNLSFVCSIKLNEMFVLGLSDEDYNYAVENGDKSLLNEHIYRVQSISKSDYWFRLHTDTENDKTPSAKDAMRYYRIKSLGALMALNPHKVKISLLGEIIK